MKVSDSTKILIVDDRKDNLSVISKYLKDAGYKYSIASNGITALERAVRIKPGLVLLDIKMPVMDGFEVCRKLKNSEKTHNIPVIFLTALDDIENKKTGFDIGGVDYLTKPIHKEELLARVNTHLENYQYKKRLEQEIMIRTKNLEQEIALRKETEKKIRESLNEKKILLQEIHHRVKNNMAIICSFIGLKEDFVTNKSTQLLLRDIQQRIRTMALAHEKLYRSDNLKYINLKDYFNDLFDDMVLNYSNASKKISKNFTIDNISLPLDLLIPVGLITNEILLNSFKHAFNNIQNPCVSIELKQKSKKDIIYKISDNGPGFTLNTAPQNKLAYGIKIIQALVQQIKGSVTINSENGTEYVIIFPASIRA